MESIPSSMNFISQIFLVEKMVGQRLVINLRALNNLCEWNTSKWTTRPTPTKGWGDENGFERCLPPNSNLPRSPTSPEIYLGAELL